MTTDVDSSVTFEQMYNVGFVLMYDHESTIFYNL